MNVWRRTVGTRGTLVAVLVAIAGWYLLAALIRNPRTLPGPEHVLVVSLPSIAYFAGSREPDLSCAVETLAWHSLYSLARIAVGFTIGSTLGLLVGLAMHAFTQYRAGTGLVLAVVRTVPLFALIPLFLYWFGGHKIGIYLYIAFAVFVVIATNTYEAAFNVPQSFIRQCLVMSGSKWKLYQTVYCKAIQPELAGALRNVLGLSWAFSLGAEYLAADSGLGYLVYQSYLYADMGKLIVFALLYSAYGLLTFHISKSLFRYAFRWYDTDTEKAQSQGV